VPDKNLGLITHKNVALEQVTNTQWESRDIALVYSSILPTRCKLYTVCNAFSFGYLPGVRVLKADVSEHFIGSIFIGRSMTCL